MKIPKIPYPGTPHKNKIQKKKKNHIEMKHSNSFEKKAALKKMRKVGKMSLRPSALFVLSHQTKTQKKTD